MEGFVPQINVTVAVALLIDRAAATKMIASQVLHMLLTGRVGDKIACSKVKNRLAKIQNGLAKYAAQSQSKFSPPSVEQRLGSAFYLPPATAYADIRTKRQQTQAEDSGTRDSPKSKFIIDLPSTPIETPATGVALLPPPPPPFFQTLHHLPLQGEQAAAGLLLENLALMRELKRVRREEAVDREQQRSLFNGGGEEGE
jgi:hypothetical protein